RRAAAGCRPGRLAGPGSGPHPARALRRGAGGPGAGPAREPGRHPGAGGGAAPAGPAALEVGAWASYFGRDFAQAAQFAEDGALAADDAATRARCLAAGGRTHPAAGDPAPGERVTRVA